MSHPKNWRKVKLGELISERPKYGYTTSAKNEEVGPKFLRITDIQDGLVNWDEVPYCKIDDNDKDKYLLRPGDIVFARTGATTGENYYVKNRLSKEAIFASYLIKVNTDPDKCLHSYLAYFFRSPFYWGQVRNFLSGSAQPGINASLLMELEVSIPQDITTQRRIASILSAFDDKIELNNKINQTLEQMAQAIFKEWFVDFRFPGHEKVKMVDSELGKVPEGWEVVKLGYILELAYGKALRDKDRIRGNIPVYGSNGQVGWHNQKLVSGPGIIVGRKGNPGFVNWSNDDFYPIDTTFYVVPKEKCGSLHYLFYTLKRQDFEAIAADSAVPGLNRNLAYMNIVIIPNKEILHTFDYICASFRKAIKKNEDENMKLRSIRDSLLPKLMSGEIKV